VRAQSLVHTEQNISKGLAKLQVFASHSKGPRFDP